MKTDIDKYVCVCVCVYVTAVCQCVFVSTSLQLKEVIKNKYSGEVPSNGSKRCSIRFPDGLRLDIAADSIPPKVLNFLSYTSFGVMQ